MKRARRLVALVTVCASFAVASTGCGDVAVVPEPPTAGSYNLIFPNASAAVVTEGVKVFVYDSAAADIGCDRLLASRRAGQPLPAPLLETGTLSICDLVANTESTRLNVSYGDRTFLAVGFNKGADLLIGCNVGRVGPNADPVAIALGPVKFTRLLPVAKCAQLADVCSTPPRCQ